MSKQVRKFFVRLSKDERGATLVEYGIALFIAIAVGGTLLTGLGGTTSGNFTAANTAATR
jgi:Flp pilus assembly pilin Flp